MVRPARDKAGGSTDKTDTFCTTSTSFVMQHRMLCINSLRGFGDKIIECSLIICCTVASLAKGIAKMSLDVDTFASLRRP